MVYMPWHVQQPCAWGRTHANNYIFDQKKVGDHLATCLENKKFPTNRTWRVDTVKALEQVPMYCVCRMPYIVDVPMVECSVCKEWYHSVCVSVPAEAWKHQTKWRRPQCAM